MVKQKGLAEVPSGAYPHWDVAKDIGHMRESLFDCTRERREEILVVLGETLVTQPAVVFAYAYGSFLEDRPFHDIDVGVYVATADERKASSLALELAIALESDLARQSEAEKEPGESYRFPVDVRVLNGAPASFGYHVLRGRLLFCCDEAIRVQWAERVIARYLDLKPLRHRALKEAMTSWR